MGRWSYCILGSDRAYDIVAELKHLIGYDDEEDATPEILWTSPSKWSDQDQQYLKTLIEQYGTDSIAEHLSSQFDDSIDALHVAGLIFMSCGALISPELKNLIANACDQEQFVDQERTDELELLKQHTIDYDGTPISMKQYGLFESFHNRKNNASSPTGHPTTPPQTPWWKFWK